MLTMCQTLGWLSTFQVLYYIFIFCSYRRQQDSHLLPLAFYLIFKFFFLIKKNYFWLCWIFSTMYELSLVVVSSGYSLVMVLGLLVAVASLVAESSL